MFQGPWDVLIIGSGAAGLRAAIEARKDGLSVCVISKSLAGMGTSTMLSHGLFTGSTDGQSKEKHLQQTLNAGRGLNQRELVDILVEEYPDRLKELVSWGVQGASRELSFHVNGDSLVRGQPIVRVLMEKAQTLGVTFQSGLYIQKIMTLYGQSAVLAYSEKKNHSSMFPETLLQAYFKSFQITNTVRLASHGYVFANVFQDFIVISSGVLPGPRRSGFSGPCTKYDGFTKSISS